MRIDEHGVLRFFEGGDADSAAANDAAAADAAAADAGGVDAGATDASLGAAGVENAMDALGLAGLTQDAEVSPGGMTYGELAALDAMGFGKMEGVNPNNPTQSVEEALAAQNVHAFANVAVPALMGLAVPGFSTVTTVAQTLGNLASGATTVGQAISGLGLGVVAQAIGVPPGTLNAALNGNLGQVVANTTMASAPAVIGAITGVPAGIVGLGMNVSGLGQQGNQAIASNVNEALGITPSNAALGNVAQSIDEALGITGGSGGTTGGVGSSADDFGPGGEFAPPTPTASPTASPQSAGGSSALIAALLAAGLEEKDEDEPKKPEPILRRSVSPYGLMYGLDEMRG